MKTFITSLIALSLFLAPNLCYSKPRKIKFAHIYRVNGQIDLGARMFAQELQKQFPNEFEITIYPESQLGDRNHIFEILNAGAIEFAILPYNQIFKISNKFRVLDLPFIFEDFGSVVQFQYSETGLDLLKEIEEKSNIKGVTYLHGGMRQLFNKVRPIRVPYDLRGLRFRPITFSASSEMFKALGAKSVMVPYNQVFQAIQAGVIDGQETTLPFFENMKLYEVTKYITLSNHSYLGSILVANKRFFNSLAPDMQKIITDIAINVSQHTNELIFENSIRKYSEIKAQGVVITNLTGKERNTWRDTMKPIWEKYSSEIGSHIIQVASGTGGGGDPCSIDTCRCRNRTCKKECCSKPLQ